MERHRINGVSLFLFFPLSAFNFSFERILNFGPVYQMATKKGGEGLGRRGWQKTGNIRGYQMDTRGTFSFEKVPLFLFVPPFPNFFVYVRGVILA